MVSCGLSLYRRIINRPGIVGDVLETPTSLIDSLFNSLTHSSFWKISSKYRLSQTVNARDLKFLEKVHPTPHVTCDFSCGTCHMSDDEDEKTQSSFLKISAKYSLS